MAVRESGPASNASMSGNTSWGEPPALGTIQVAASRLLSGIMETKIAVPSPVQRGWKSQRDGGTSTVGSPPSRRWTISDLVWDT